MKNFDFDLVFEFINGLFGGIGATVMFLFGLCLGHSKDEIKSNGFEFGILDVIRGVALCSITYIPWAIWGAKRKEEHDYVEQKKEEQ